MANHPARSKRNRTVALKIGSGGHYTHSSKYSTSDLITLVRDVPASVATADVLLRLNKVVLLPMTGPWTIAWERLADAAPGSVLRDAGTHKTAEGERLTSAGLTQADVDAAKREMLRHENQD